jgi:DNA (cytosine-5)-methyltransferase 1
LNYLDLFSGIGGFALGAYWAGWRFDNHYFSEVDDYAIRVYQQRFPEAINLGDITKIVHDSQSDRWKDGTAKNKWTSKGALDPLGNSNPIRDWIITGGFPCQDISCAGKGEGIEGRRSGLWFAMRDIIRLLRPRYAIIENVGAITSRGLARVLSSLAEIGYDAEWQDIRASDVGAPHRRERIWIVAYPQRGGCWKTGQRERLDEISRQWANIGSEAQEPSQDVADTERKGSQGRLQRRECTGELSAWACCSAHEDEWLAQSEICRVSHGVRNRVDRLKCLGNSIVPQIAEILFRRIAEIEYK